MTPKNRSRAAARPARRASPTCRGGASSLLRLTPAEPSRRPSAFGLGAWIDRAVHALRIPPVPAFAPSEFVA
ncbi:MAG TPA: hypothetical protein VFX50_15265 [Gemmatimonadales bacterium]|nr:hypothetical protein [Gemmatimonadales bacterium]